MLMSDTWQPAVLQLLPFSTNDASNPQTPTATPRLRPVSFPDQSRGFPVLAVTRRDKENGDTYSPRGRGQGGHGGQGVGTLRPTRSKSSSERMTKSQGVVDPASLGSNPRAKSEYYPRRNGSSAAHGRVRTGGGAGGSLQSRDPATCSITDLNDRVLSRAGRRPDSGSSPDSGAGSLGNPPYVTSPATEHGWGSGGGGGGKGFPKPSFPPNALSPSTVTAAGVIGSGNGSNNAGETRYMVSKNGMWRSVTLTPGELELKKHRDLLERVNTAHSTVTVDSKAGRQYHKMNVRDLPRSNTPVNDHDPDKLNMKQVIAFLQSKGKSQADAVELPRGVRGRASSPGQPFLRSVKSGALRGSVRRPTASSTAAEIIMRSSGRWEARDASPLRAASGGKEGEGVRASATSLPSTRPVEARSRRSTGSREAAEKREHPREGGEVGDRRQERGDNSPRQNKASKKPFRLHRFLTMVPSAREQPAVATSLTPPPSHTRSSAHSADTAYTPSKSAQKERTLCLGLASQSKSQSRDTTENRQFQVKVHYRLAAARPRPSSLHVEQDPKEAQWKLSTDFGEKDSSSKAVNFQDVVAEELGKSERKNIIRLPFVMVDSEDEDMGFARPESRNTANSRPRTSTPKYAKHTKASSQKTGVKKKHTSETIKDEDGGAGHSGQTSNVDVRWALEEKESQVLMSSSQVSASSSLLPAPSRSTASSSLKTASYSEVFSDHSHDWADTKLPELPGDNNRLTTSATINNAPTENGGLDARRRQTSPTHRRVNVKVDLPSNRQDTDESSARPSKLPERVTLSLRKERNRTRELTYMSEIGGSDALSDDTCAARINSESMRMSVKSDDLASWAS